MNVYKKTHASVAKLVDATDSKSVSRKGVLVQVRPEVPKLNSSHLGAFFYIIKTPWTFTLKVAKLKTILWRFYENILPFKLARRTIKKRCRS